MQYLVPTELETERLQLRQFEENDWIALHAYYSDPAATQYTIGRALTEGETWRAMCSMIGHWQVRAYGPYAVIDKSTQQLLGPVGFWFPQDWPSPEIKWALAPDYWGKGYASEAARAVQKAGREYLPDISLISLIHPQNHASINLAGALGAAFEKGIYFRGENWNIYRHPE